MRIVPITLKQANEFVSAYHRHHGVCRGCKFAIGCMENDNLIGVAICGRPVSRYLDNGLTLEVSRLCTNGTRNACSMLYGACARIAKDMGYKRVITYILQSESGTSLIASGWINEGLAGGVKWTGKRQESRKKQPITPHEMKQRFAKYFK